MEELELKKALYETKCDCGSKIYWEGYYDADDGATWSADCCGKHYVLITTKVRLYIDEQ